MLSFKEGDRVELVSMGNDPDPIKPGTKGTVTGTFESTMGLESAIYVAWDNGRHLNAIVGKDVLKHITKEEE